MKEKGQGFERTGVARRAENQLLLHYIAEGIGGRTVYNMPETQTEEEVVDYVSLVMTCGTMAQCESLAEHVRQKVCVGSC